MLGCKALALVNANRDTATIILRKFGHEAVITALNGYRANEEIQHFGCRAIAALADGHEAKPLIREKGGVDAVMIATK